MYICRWYTILQYITTYILVNILTPRFRRIRPTWTGACRTPSNYISYLLPPAIVCICRDCWQNISWVRSFHTRSFLYSTTKANTGRLSLIAAFVPLVLPFEDCSSSCMILNLNLQETKEINHHKKLRSWSEYPQIEVKSSSIISFFFFVVRKVWTTSDDLIMSNGFIFLFFKKN